jgi:hypothetical protein
VLVLKLLSPLYTAVIECEATLNELVLKVAEPALSAFVASEVAPSLNVTVPVGVPAPAPVGVTVAVKVTDWPKTVGLAEEANAVALPLLLTVCEIALEVLVVKLPSPPYTAVIACAATLSEDVLKVAWPELRLPVPIVVAPSLNVTVPVGVPAPAPLGVTVAVNVTDCPNTVGLVELLSAVAVPAWLTVCVTLPDMLALKLPSPL